VTWRNPVPIGARSGVRVFRPGEPLRRVIEAVCIGGWRGLGVRVYAWPCGTLAVVPRDTDSDARLATLCGDRLHGTYARRMTPDGLQGGPQWRHVAIELQWSRAHA